MSKHKGENEVLANIPKEENLLTQGGKDFKDNI